MGDGCPPNYILNVSDLQRIKIANSLLREVLPSCNNLIDKDEYIQVIKTTTNWLDKSFEAVKIEKK